MKNMWIKILILCFKKAYTTNKPITARFIQYVSVSETFKKFKALEVLFKRRRFRSIFYVT